MDNNKNVYNSEEMKKQLFKYIAFLKTHARLMLDGATYQQTITQVGISSATLSRVNRCILYGNGGYNKILATYLSEENSKGKA